MLIPNDGKTKPTQPVTNPNLVEKCVALNSENAQGPEQGTTEAMQGDKTNPRSSTPYSVLRQSRLLGIMGPLSYEAGLESLLQATNEDTRIWSLKSPVLGLC